MTDPSRYHRQSILEHMGEDGQRRLGAARVLVVGCGALGSVAAESLARAGVGSLRIVDRDVVEPTNLQRQVLFDEADAAAGLPKAEAARRQLGRINHEVEVEAVVSDFTAANALRLGSGCDLLLDGTDNFETRFLLNDLAVKLDVPYVYGGAVATRGMVYVVIPGDGPCLRCLFDQAPPPGLTETCDTVGVLGPACGVVANLQAGEAIKFLSGNRRAVSRQLIAVDLWSTTFRAMDMAGAADAACPCCRKKRFDYLSADAGAAAVRFCGRHAVQVSADATSVDLEPVARRLAAHGPVQRNDFLLRGQLEDAGRPFELTLFRDGRAIIRGTDDPAVARSLYARYVGA